VSGRNGATPVSGAKRIDVRARVDLDPGEANLLRQCVAPADHAARGRSMAQLRESCS